MNMHDCQCADPVVAASGVVEDAVAGPGRHSRPASLADGRCTGRDTAASAAVVAGQAVVDAADERRRLELVRCVTTRRTASVRDSCSKCGTHSNAVALRPCFGSSTGGWTDFGRVVGDGDVIEHGPLGVHVVDLDVVDGRARQAAPRRTRRPATSSWRLIHSIAVSRESAGKAGRRSRGFCCVVGIRFSPSPWRRSPR